MHTLFLLRGVTFKVRNSFWGLIPCVDRISIIYSVYLSNDISLYSFRNTRDLTVADKKMDPLVLLTLSCKLFQLDFCGKICDNLWKRFTLSESDSKFSTLACLNDFDSFFNGLVVESCVENSIRFISDRQNVSIRTKFGKHIAIEGN